MALLRSRDGTQLLPMPARCLVGRGPGATLRIQDPRVSTEHARLSWDGQRWSVRDLGSTNGTYVAGRVLGAGETVPLHRGIELAFGDPSLAFLLDEATAPSPVARRSSTGGLRSAEGGVLALPDEEQPLALVFEDAKGAWVLEQDGLAAPVADGDLVQVGEEAWVLHLPVGIDPTLAVRATGVELSQVRFLFRVSDDEERVALRLFTPTGEEELPPVAHLYTLLTLARLRVRDAEEGSEGQRGWVYADALCKMLAVDDLRLNVDVYRCRKALGQLGILGASGVVERHRGTRQLRFGSDLVEIERL